MSGAHVPLVTPPLVFVLAWALLAALIAAAHALARRRLARIEPAQRANVLLASALLPPTCAAAVALLGFTASFGAPIVGGHCHDGLGCAAHVPAVHAATWSALLVDALLASAVVVAVLGVTSRLRRSLVVAKMLRRLAELGGPRSTTERGFAVIDTQSPIACCVGLLRPSVIVSRGLLDAMSPSRLRIVLAHEHAHAARRDNLRNWLAGVSLLPLPAALRRRLLADLALAAEQACDRAALRVSDPKSVAHTIRMLEGAAVAASRRAAPFTTSATSEDRIRALESADDETRLPPHALVAATLLVYWLAALVIANLAHHGIELLSTLV